MTTEPESEEKRSKFYEGVRKVALAAVGATMIATEELEAFVNRLAERGEMGEKDVRRLMREVIERREKAEQERKAAAERNAPPPPATRADVEALSARIAELTAKLEEMKAKQK
mgnify:CR=1 FL=1